MTNARAYQGWTGTTAHRLTAHRLCVSLNSRLGSNKEKKKEPANPQRSGGRDECLLAEARPPVESFGLANHTDLFLAQILSLNYNHLTDMTSEPAAHPHGEEEEEKRYRVRSANMAHIRQSRPDSGLDFQAKSLQPLKVFPLRSEAVDGHGGPPCGLPHTGVPCS